MNRFTPRLAAIVLLVLIVSTGCTHPSSRRPSGVVASPRPVAYALAVSVQGGLQPSPAQWAAVQALFARELAAVGCVLVTDLALADRILRVDFIPSLTDPETRGHAVIVSVRANPLRNLTLGSSLVQSASYRYPTSFGFAGAFTAYGGSWNDPYYGFGHSYYDGYTYSTPTLNPRTPVPPSPPHHPNHSHRPDHAMPTHPGRPHPPTDGTCPPLLAWRPARSTPEPVAYAATESSRPLFPDDIRRVGPDRSFVRTDRSDRTERTYAQSNPNPNGAAATDTSRSWVGRLFHRSDSADANPNQAAGRTDRTRWNGEGSDSNRDRSYNRTDSTRQHSERTYSHGDSGRGSSDRSYARSDSGSSRSESSHSHSSRSETASSSASASSYSAPSYTPPPSSSSFDSSSSASSASSSYSTGSTSTVTSTPANTAER
ncbi:hypothetical protein [Horticoccus sp. 23ND18S-11]|uniref:hypothetical protein n=1 Tax=Horticoccus sp. 23ND18S-11 TaxID=3391832 RepID=UPI0039C8D9B9